MATLINRERELALLDELWRKRFPALGLLYGRRRVGKTYLLQRFLREHRGIYFLAAESSSPKNLEELLDQVRRAFPERQDATLPNYLSWRAALGLLCDLATLQPLLVVFDEFGHLCHAEPDIASLIQAAWDEEARGTQLKLILCGSEIGTLAAIDNCGEPLHGRFDWVEQLRPLDYYDSSRFLVEASPPGQAYPARDLLRAYALFGGSSSCLDAMDPRRPLSGNVANLLLAPLGVLHREGEILIRQERNIRDFSNYNAVLAAVASGAAELGEIASQSHLGKPTVRRCLKRLQQIDWVEQDRPFEESDRRATYRLKDNFLNSWYRYVFRFKSALQISHPAAAWTELLAPDIDNYMVGGAFPAICAQHLARFAPAYGLSPIAEMGRWWSPGGDLELDIVLRGPDGGYLFGECRWSGSPIDADVLERLVQKVQQTPDDRWKASPRYALFSAGGFTQRLVAAARERQVLLVGPAHLFRGLSRTS